MPKSCILARADVGGDRSLAALCGEDRLDERGNAAIVVAGNEVAGVVVHVLGCVGNNEAVTGRLEHLDIVVGIAHGGCIGDGADRIDGAAPRPC